MTILLFLFGVAVAAGLFFILADILKLPRLSTEKALLSAGRAEKKRMKSLDAIFLGWAIKLSHFIRMDEYKRHRMERTLSAAGMDMTPEVYLAYTILKPAAALLAVYGKPCGETAQLLCRTFSRRKLQALTDLFHRYCDECQYNVGVGHVLGALGAELADVVSH